MNASAATLTESEREQARLHGVLRFAAGVTAAFVLCEFMAWVPTFMGPVLAVVLMANLPMRPPLKIAVVLVIVITLAASYAFLLTTLLGDIPALLFGLITLSIFLAFYSMLLGKPALPAMLLLICLATIPVVALTVPDYGTILPAALIRGMVVALLAIWTAYLLWPVPPIPAPAAPASTPAATPLAVALLSTAVVVPVMLVFLLFGLTDALPVLAATVMLVATFDQHRGRTQSLAMIVGNFLGGLLGVVLHAVLLTAPSLPFLAGLLFLVLLGFGKRIVAGGPAAGVAVVACNGMLIIFSSAIASGPGSLSLWTTRLLQFSLAGVFAVGMMSLISYRPETPRP